MKIQEVTIEGYQSHTNSTFRLSPGLTVITGPSDAGKTAIIRALRVVRLLMNDRGSVLTHNP